MEKVKVGITGQAGFIGTHLYNTLALESDISCIPFQDEYFDDPDKMDAFVKQCDTVVHLAAVNRHHDLSTLYQTNIDLVEKLIAACQRTQSRPHILFSSSIQESRDNEYGRSKKEGRLRFEKWARENNAGFTGLVIPNVFGPFGNPNYNSVVATFSHQLVNNEKPEIQIDGQLELIYISDLCREIIKLVRSKPNRQSIETVHIPAPYSSSVSSLLDVLKLFQEQYLEKGEIPNIQYNFHCDLFNTFRSYIPANHFPFHLDPKTDNRGAFVEIVRSGSSGQFSFSTTKPGITRGNHFHTRKVERFAVIQGSARIQLRRVGTGKIIEYDLDGLRPAFVDMPIWYTHNITNTGDADLYTLFWINEPFNSADPDTFFETV